MPKKSADLNEEYEAIPFSLNEYQNMSVLFKSAFDINISRTSFVKRFDTTSLGCEVIGYIAIHKESRSPAAYYGVFPEKLLIDNKVILGAQSGDTMTHMGHRKKGLFVWLANKTFEKCKEKGISLVYGIPNNNSYPGFINRLNWSHIDNINSYDLKLSFKTFPLPKLLLKVGAFGIYMKAIRLVLERDATQKTESFSNPIESNSKVLRDTNYLSYKKSDNKIFLTVRRVKLWVCLTDVFWIGDFDNYENVDMSVIKRLKRIARLLGYNTIRFNFNESLPKPSFLQVFKKSGQEPSCYYYIDNKLQNTNLVLTAADFDTW